MRGRPIAMLALFVSAIGLACGGSGPTKPPPQLPMHLISVDSIKVGEPSDLAINDSATCLWTVTNNPARVYQLGMHGKVKKKLNYQGSDLEAIAYDPSDRTLWIVEERAREIVHIDLNGDVLSRKLLGLVGEPNHGPEGMCRDRDGHFFLVNEMNPGLFIQLGPDLSVASWQVLTFAIDYSGLAATSDLDRYYMVSDESKKLYLWSKRTGIVNQFDLPFPKAEGVAVDEATRRIYVVSDSENKLYTYQLE